MRHQRTRCGRFARPHNVQMPLGHLTGPGILVMLDMVGAKDAQFHREGYSMEFAPGIVRKVWDHAQRLGYSHVFIPKTQEPVTDDHYFVNTIARIPMINVVHFEPGIGYFGDIHHSQKDNLDLISKETLRIVGTTVLNTIALMNGAKILRVHDVKEAIQTIKILKYTYS